MGTDISVNYQHKDRLFKRVFGSEENKENTLSLYNAVNGTDYENKDELSFNTIDDVIYMSMKNDVSFLIGNVMNLYEQQSTMNPNMPIRGVIYLAKLFNKYIELNHVNIYSTKQAKLPTPKYIVFYNGEDDAPDVFRLSLDDAFEFPEKSDLHFSATVININEGKNLELMERCKALREYSVFVNRVRTAKKNGARIEDAVTQAVDSCIQEGILVDVLKPHKAEVIDMCITEYNEEEVLRMTYGEGLEEGVEKGRAKGREEERVAMLKKASSSGMDTSSISRIFDIPEEDVIKAINS